MSVGSKGCVNTASGPPPLAIFAHPAHRITKPASHTLDCFCGKGLLFCWRFRKYMYAFLVHVDHELDFHSNNACLQTSSRDAISANDATFDAGPGPPSNLGDHCTEPTYRKHSPSLRITHKSATTTMQRQQRSIFETPETTPSNLRYQDGVQDGACSPRAWATSVFCSLD